MGQGILTPRARPGSIPDLAERERLLRRQRRPRAAGTALRRVLLAAGVTLAVIVLLGLGWLGVQWAVRTPWLAVRSLEVLGLGRLGEREIVEAAGIRPGTNLLALDPAVIQARLEALPQVERARVVRRLPDRIALLIQERDPYALANADGLFWLDPEGRVLGPERSAVSPRLPILSGLALPPPGTDAAVPDRVESGLRLLRIIQRLGGRLAARVAEIELGRPEGPVLYTQEGIEVRIGTEEWAERLARLDALLASLEERNERVESIDLRFRDLVVMRPRGAPPDGRTGPRPGREEHD